ncbi:unnamed protein product [Protopolystoma xenopodis]|uniref:Uncharacterized protein n=1 Tax=Protopolystoma xenopodis TaxID=117903 RepID=A0A448XQ00_9PLAT|nr:unnamed protein product [Protopolystoma xenopodis]
MGSCSEDVRHMTDEKSARIHQSRKVVRRSLFRTNVQSQLQGNPPTASGETKLRISSSRLFNRIGRYTNINHVRDSSNPSFSAYSHFVFI